VGLSVKNSLKNSVNKSTNISRPNDPRLGEIILPYKPRSARGFVLIGYPDDQGVKLNYGRIGSQQAPNKIREYFAKLTPATTHSPAIYDAGNIEITENIAKNHAAAQIQASVIHKEGHNAISLGGGHDYAYPDVAAFLSLKHKKKPVILNFDAHLDMRPDEHGLNSGTAFYRLLENHTGFDLIEVGIQKHANGPHFLNYAKNKKTKVLFFEDVHQNLVKKLKSLKLKGRPIFISLDMDVFCSSQAPGVSAPAPIGLDAREFIEGLSWLNKNCGVQHLGIYELNPTFDLDDKTSRLAAVIMQRYIYGC